jgi:formylglycine-generating enzyme required for sulfatase activity
MNKYFLLLILAMLFPSQAYSQTLHIAPIYEGGIASFEVDNGTPGSLAIVCYSVAGSGPFTVANGLIFNLSSPINPLQPLVLDGQGSGVLGPFSVPSSAVAGMQVWFQAAHKDTLANPSWTTTNMVPITVLAQPPIPPDMTLISSGTFEMGDHAGVGYASELPVHTVNLDGYYIDKYEVTNGKFVDYLNNANVNLVGDDVFQVGGAGKQICDLLFGLNHNGFTYGIDGGKTGHPVVRVSWYGATLYCNYLSLVDGRVPCYDESTFDCDYTANGYRLPTEAESEYANRGGEQNPYYLYPWGADTINSSDANYNYNVNTTMPVGSYLTNGFGLYDMGGNVWEWCGDWYDSTYYSSSPTDNPTGPAIGWDRVVRGGSWINSDLFLRSAKRTYTIGHIITDNLGFRAVLSE